MHKENAVPPPRGFTLWELLCTLGISALLLGLGVPSLHRFLLDSRRTAAVNAFVLAVQVARTEAAKRGEAVVLCASRDGSRCANEETGYGAGWIVFYDRDPKSPPQRSDAEPLIYAYRPELRGSIVGNRDLLRFPAGHAPQHERHARVLRRARAARGACGDRELHGPAARRHRRPGR